MWISNYSSTACWKDYPLSIKLHFALLLKVNWLCMFGSISRHYILFHCYVCSKEKLLMSTSLESHITSVLRVHLNIYPLLVWKLYIPFELFLYLLDILGILICTFKSLKLISIYLLPKVKIFECFIFYYNLHPALNITAV